MARTLKETSIIGVLFIIIVLGMYTLASAQLANPLTFTGSSALTPVVSPGGLLKIRATAIVKDRCQFTHSRYIEAANGEIVYRDVVPGRLNMSENRIFTVPVPEGLKPGNYVYRQTTFSSCKLLNYSTEFPSLGFEIR